MGSPDPILKMLKDFSYQVVRLPRAKIRPLQILSKKANDLVFLGEASEIFIPGSAGIPTIDPDEEAAFINGKRSRNLDLSVGLNLLGGIIGAMRGSKVKLDAGYKRASQMVFEFEDVKVNKVSQISLDKYLSGARIDPAVGPGLKTSLNKGELYVIVSTIKSNKFTTDALQANGITVGVDVPVIKEIVGGSVGLTVGGQNSSKVTYIGQTPLIFGIQAARIDFAGGTFNGLVQVSADDSAMRAPRVKTTEPQYEMLELETPFVNLKDDQKPVKSGTKKSVKKAKPGSTKASTKKAAAKKSSTKKGGAKKGGAVKGTKKSVTKKSSKKGAKVKSKRR